MNSARLELTPSNPKSGIVTIWPYQRSIFLFFAARARRATHLTHAQHSKREREAVMTDGGSQPPIEQRSTPRICHTLVVWPAAACVARRGCNVMLVFSACYLMSRFLGRVSGKNTKHQKY